jgi:hypothetical protein
MTKQKAKTTPTAKCVGPKKWIAGLRASGETKLISTLEWATRDQAKGEAGRWLIMLQRSGRA